MILKSCVNKQYKVASESDYFEKKLKTERYTFTSWKYKDQCNKLLTTSRDFPRYRFGDIFIDIKEPF